MKTQGLRSDPEGDVELVEAFWNNERLGLGGATVPIPLVIADVLASLDGRNIEAARELREIWLRGVKSCAATRARRIARDRRRAGGARGGERCWDNIISQMHSEAVDLPLLWSSQKKADDWVSRTQYFKSV